MSVEAGSWSNKEFKVNKVNPSPWEKIDVLKAYTTSIKAGEAAQAAYDQEQADSNNPPVSNAVANEIEQWLKTVAQEYENMGFKPPSYTDTDNNGAFKVYVYPFSGGGPAGMLLGCQNSGKLYMKFDSVRNVDNGKLTVKAYQDLAHELFHAVQGSYDLYKQSGCPGFWITEGTAEAVGIEMARKLKGKEPYTVCQVGSRSYSDQLFVRKPKTPTDLPCGLSRAYQTQSFWQFLGEYITRQHVKKILQPEEFVAPDFRYLHRFFSTPHAIGSPSSEYAWLDKVLRSAKHYGKNQFGIKLHTAYSNFVGTIASYWKHKRRNRYPGGSGGNPGKKERRWIEKVMFSPCEKVLVSKASTPTISVPLQIEPVAARCIEVKFDFKERVKLTFFAWNNSSIYLESLAVSTDGGKKIVRRHPAEQHPSKLGHFTVSPKPGRSQYFIVSNVAQDAAQTVSLNPTIQIVPEISSSTGAKAKKKNEPNPDPTPKDELENTLESRSWTGQARQSTGGPCKRPFEARPCGPYTNINLGLVSDTSKIALESIQPSMSLDRMIDVFGAMDQKGGVQTVDDLTDQQMKILQQDAAGISLTLPQIQPGFTGAISKAHFLVSKALNADGSYNGTYRAVGTYVGACGEGYYPANGTVTITEFSKNVIRGTFSTQLKDSKVLNAVQYCGSVPVARTIKGDFTISEINFGLNQPAPNVGDDAIIDRTVEDFNEVLPGLMSEELRQQAKDHAKKRRQINKQLKQQKQASGGKLKQCQNCQCPLEPAFCQSNPQSPCCQFCDPIFKMCKHPQASHQPSNQSTHSPAAQAKEAAEIQAMRKKYEAYVDTFAPNQIVKQGMMDHFDKAKTINEKKILMMAVP